VAAVGEQLQEAERDLAVAAGDEDFHRRRVPHPHNGEHDSP
jgi:hypothetical protein